MKHHYECFARIFLISSQLNMTRKLRKQSNFDINTYDWDKCHSKNVMIKKINFHVNCKMSKWRLRDELESSSTNRFVKNDKQESKNRSIKTKNFYIAQISWNELQLVLSKSKAFAFAILFDQKMRMNCILNDDAKIKNNERITNEISSQYAKFQDIFSKMNAHKISEHDS